MWTFWSSASVCTVRSSGPNQRSDSQPTEIDLPEAGPTHDTDHLEEVGRFHGKHPRGSLSASIWKGHSIRRALRGVEARISLLDHRDAPFSPLSNFK